MSVKLEEIWIDDSIIRKLENLILLQKDNKIKLIGAPEERDIQGSEEKILRKVRRFAGKWNYKTVFLSYNDRDSRQKDIKAIFYR